MNLNDTVEFYIRTTSLALSRMYNAIAADYGITQTVGYILIYVKKDGTSSSKIANLLGMKKSSLTRILQKMEDDGCITRQVDKSDKRIVNIFLTKKGVERRRIAKKTVLEFNAKLTELTDEKDLKSFAKVSKLIGELTQEKLENTQK